MTMRAQAAMAKGVARWANPSSPHAEGRAARAALEEARGRIAAAYGWDGEVLLTSGASESVGIALGRANVARRLVSAVEHDAVWRAWPGAEVVAVGRDGLVSLATGASTSLSTNGEEGVGATSFGLSDVEGLALVAVQWANSETGVRQPIAALAEAVHAAGHLLLVDAAQMPAGADPDIAHADFVALSAHKHGGPPGIGALLVRDLATLGPSGGQERGYRPGTENMPAAVGWAAALSEPEPVERWASLRARLDDAVARSGGEVVAVSSPRHPAIGSYRLPGTDGRTQLIRLDLAGIAVSAGSACSSGSMKPSHVLAAMGWDDAVSREVIRVSFGRETSEADVDRFVVAWRELSRGARRIAA